MELLSDDPLTHIFSFVNSGSTFKSVLYTCRRWNILILSVYPNGKIIFANHLRTLLKFLPNKPWDYDWLSGNPSINWEIVRNNPEIPWNYDCLSINTFKR